MTEETAKSDDAATTVEEKDDGKPTLFDQPEGTDWFLAYFVWLADGFSIEQNVTLTVGGSLMSGMLISGRTYFEELGTLLKNIGNMHVKSGEDGKELLESLAETYSNFSQVYPKPAPDSEREFRKVGYIHMRNAKIFTADGKAMPNPDGMLWRGKMSAIDGFMIGGLSAS